MGSRKTGSGNNQGRQGIDEEQPWGDPAENTLVCQLGTPLLLAPQAAESQHATGLSPLDICCPAWGFFTPLYTSETISDWFHSFSSKICGLNGVCVITRSYSLPGRRKGTVFLRFPRRKWTLPPTSSVIHQNRSRVYGGQSWMMEISFTCLVLA
jgi:hypothetical protein